jgi:ribonuclease P protein component
MGAVNRVQRLTSKAQFQSVMAGAPVAKTAHFALHRSALDVPSDVRSLFPVTAAWVGVVLPKRWARRAVTRNAIRRQIHELSRLHAEALPQAAWVIRLRSEFSRKQFVSATSEPLKRAVRAELEQLLGRVLKRPMTPEQVHVG